MTHFPRMFDMIPLWLQLAPDGASATLSLEKGEDGILLHDDNLGDYEGVLTGLSRPSFMLFDLPSEARVAAAAIMTVEDDSFEADAPVAGRTPSGEGVLMVFDKEVLDINEEDLTVTDHRTRTGYQLPVHLSWELQGCECDSALEQPQSDRVDLAAVLRGKIAEVANPDVLRSLQTSLQALRGASVGLPLIEMADLDQDIEIHREIDPDQLQAALVRYADRIDCSDQIDALARHLLEAFPDQIRQKLHADEPLM